VPFAGADAFRRDPARFIQRNSLAHHSALAFYPLPGRPILAQTSKGGDFVPQAFETPGGPGVGRGTQKKIVLNRRKSHGETHIDFFAGRKNEMPENAAVAGFLFLFVGGGLRRHTSLKFALIRYRLGMRLSPRVGQQPFR
jgi:hypothetical protein